MSISLANLITASRLIFFVCFIYAAQTQQIAGVVVWFMLAWGLDAVDGWVARRWNQTTKFGYIFDKVTDRVVLFIGLLILLINKLVPDYTILVLTKDIAVLPAASAQIYTTKAMSSMGRLGRITTVAQGITILWALLSLPLSWLAVFTVAILGGITGMIYLRQV